MCFVSMTSVLNSSSTFRGCQETTVNPKDVCNITIQGADGSVTKTCCCNSSSCNNETFLQQCSNDSLPLPDTFSCHHEVASVGRTVRYAYQDCRGTHYAYTSELKVQSFYSRFFKLDKNK